MKALIVNYNITDLKNSKVEKGEMVVPVTAAKLLELMFHMCEIQHNMTKFENTLHDYIQKIHCKDMGLTKEESKEIFSLSNITHRFFEEYKTGIKVSCLVKHKDMPEVRRMVFNIPVRSGLFEAKLCILREVRSMVFAALTAVLKFPAQLGKFPLFQDCWEIMDLEWEEVNADLQPDFDLTAV